MNKFTLFFSFFLFSLLCNSQSCHQLNIKGTSYETTLKRIKSAEFNFSDTCNIKKSSWIYNAEFYSCDKQDGFFLLTTKKKTYIYKEIPLKLWLEFKKADSFGRFYNERIKGKY